MAAVCKHTVPVHTGMSRFPNQLPVSDHSCLSAPPLLHSILFHCSGTGQCLRPHWEIRELTNVRRWPCRAVVVQQSGCCPHGGLPAGVPPWLLARGGSAASCQGGSDMAPAAQAPSVHALHLLLLFLSNTQCI